MRVGQKVWYKPSGYKKVPIEVIFSGYSGTKCALINTPEGRRSVYMRNIKDSEEVKALI